MMAVLTPWPHLTRYRGPQLCTSMSRELLVLLEALFLHIWCVGPWCWHGCLQVVSPHWHSSNPLVGRLQIWVAVPKILETAALQHFWCRAPWKGVSVPCITGTYSRLGMFTYEEVSVFVFLTFSFLLT